MAYESNPGPGAGAEAPAAAPPDQAPEAPKAESNTFHLSSDMFPPGMAKTLKAGDVIEFRIVSPLDRDDDVEVEYNHGEEAPGEAAGEKSESWESDFRKEMSPQAEQTEAM